MKLKSLLFVTACLVAVPLPGAAQTVRETVTVSFPTANVPFIPFATPQGGFFSIITPGKLSGVPADTTTKQLVISGNRGDVVTIRNDITTQTFAAVLDGRPDSFQLSCTGSVTLRLEPSCVSCSSSSGGACEVCAPGQPCRLFSSGSSGPCARFGPAEILRAPACECGTLRQVSDSGASGFGSPRIVNFVCQ